MTGVNADGEVIARLVSALSAAQTFLASAAVTPAYITYKDLSAKRDKAQSSASKKKKAKKGAAGTDNSDATTNNTNAPNNSAAPDATEPSEGGAVPGISDSTPSEPTASTETLDL